MKEKFFFFDNPKNAVLFCFGFLLLIGGINVYSASFVYAASEMENGYHFAQRYLVFAMLSTVVLCAVWKFGYRKLLNINSLFFFGATVVVLLIAVLFFGPKINEAKRWLDFGFVHLQPSEFVKLFIIMVCSKFLGDHILKGKRANIFHAPTLYCLAAAGFFATLVYVEPDMGTAGLIMGLACFLCFLAGVPWIQIFLVLSIALSAAALFIFRAAYRFNRVLMWLDPWQDPTGDGYQMVQSYIAIGSGGFFGMDWGAGTAKLFFLPELHTDFAFAIFCQENGFIGALGMICIFALLGFALWTIARRTNDPTGFLLVSGIIFLVVGQAVANMAMVCGLLPIIGVPLSFISYGGSSMVASSLGLGLALSVYDEECYRQKELAKLAQIEELSPEERRKSWIVIEGGKK